MIQVGAASTTRRQEDLRDAATAGFTLIELLVVIGVLAVLAALLLPGLHRAKAQALSVACLNNLKQLQLCSHLYTLDNQDSLPPNDFCYDVNTLLPLPGFNSSSLVAAEVTRLNTLGKSPGNHRVRE